MDERAQTLQYIKEIYGTTVSEATLLRLFEKNNGSLDRICSEADGLNLEEEKKLLQAERVAKREKEAALKQREVEQKVFELRARCPGSDVTDSFFIDVLDQAKGDVSQAARMIDTTKHDDYSFLPSGDGKKEKPDLGEDTDLARRIREQQEILSKIEENRRREDQRMEEKIRRDFDEKARRDAEKKEKEEKERKEREERYKREGEERIRREREEAERKEKFAREEEKLKRAREDEIRREQEEKLRLLEQKMKEEKETLLREQQDIARRREEMERAAAEKKKMEEKAKLLEEEMRRMAEEAKKLEELRLQLEREKEKIKEVPVTSVPVPAPAPVPAPSSAPSSSSSPSSSSPSPSPSSRPPKVCVYKHSDTVISSVDMDKLIAICILKDIPKEDIGVIDVTNNLDAQSRLVEMCGHFEYPMIFICDNPVGNFEQVLKLSKENGKFEALLQGKVNLSGSSQIAGDPAAALLKSVIINPNPEIQGIDSMTPEETEEQLRLGVVGGMLGVTETVLSGVSTIVTLPIAILTWPFRSQPVEERLEDGDEEYLVIQSNWYARSQWRTYRFKKNEFLRLHPNGQVRARHPYTAVKSIEFTDRKNIILHYTGDEAPDYLQATAENIQKMVKRWTEMNKEVVIVGFQM